MTKYEFLKELREALEGQVPMSEIEDSISYTEITSAARRQMEEASRRSWKNSAAQG